MRQAAVELERDLAAIEPSQLRAGLADDAARMAFWIDVYNAAVLRQPDHDFSGWRARCPLLWSACPQRRRRDALARHHRARHPATLPAEAGPGLRCQPRAAVCSSAGSACAGSTRASTSHSTALRRHVPPSPPTGRITSRLQLDLATRSYLQQTDPARRRSPGGYPPSFSGSSGTSGAARRATLPA